MSKRKESEISSDSSDVYNPDEFSLKFSLNFTPNSPIECCANPNFKKQKTSLTIKSEPSSNDLGAGIWVQFFNAQLNGAPFFDFFAQGKIGGFVIQPVKPTSADVSPTSPASYPDCLGPSSSGKSSECWKDVIEAIPLRMHRPDSGIDWTIRKVLTVSDCDAQCRLLLGKAVVDQHILRHLEESSRALINSPDGLRVTVSDIDEGVDLKLTLKKWRSAKYYGLMNNWKRDFVKRRGLVAGDEVGICWDKSNNRFLFSVLLKSTVQPQEA